MFDSIKRKIRETAIRALLPHNSRSKAVDVIQLLAFLDASGFPGMPNTYYGYAIDGYSGNPDVFACVSKIATAVKGINWKVMQKNGKGQEIEQSDHPLAKLLAHPNRRLSQKQFFDWMTKYHFIAGIVYIFRAGPNDTSKPPKRLYLPRPNTVLINAGYDLDEVESYTYHPPGQVEQVWDTELVCDLSFFHPLAELYGMSPLRAAARSVDTGNLGRTWNFNLLRNNARPSGVFQIDHALDDTSYSRLREQVAENYGGANNAGRPMVLEDGLTWEQMGLTPSDMEWVSTQKFSTLDICRVYNVPPEMIADHEHATYSNYAEARKAFYHETILPYMDFLKDELNGWLCPLYGDGVYLDYDRDGIEALQEDRQMVYERLATAWWLTPNRKLELCGEARSDDPLMDKHYIPSNLVPIERPAR